MERAERFPLSIRLLHWMIATGMIILTIGGCCSKHIGPSTPLYEYIPLFHRSVGSLLLMLVAIRLLIRLSVPVPSLPGSLPNSTRVLAKIAIVMLYGFMALIPLTGYFIANYGDHGVRLYGLKMPELFGIASRDLASMGLSLHYLLAYTCISLVALHVLAVFYHRWADKIDLLHMMTFSLPHRKSDA